MNRQGLAVQLGPLQLKNPVMVASGTFGYGQEYVDMVRPDLLGALVVKGISLEPRPGNPPPRIWETYGGMLNAIGLQNVGARVFVEEKLPWLKTFAVPVIVNIFGNTLEEYRSLAAMLDGCPGIAALEINISCPNVKAGGMVFGTDPHMVSQVVAMVRSATALPIITKLTPNVTDITVTARAAEQAGSDALSLINTISGMAVNVETRRPRLANVVGGLSGPAIKPIALRLVWQVVQAVSIPVIGLGGISSTEDALEFLIAGARAIQVGTANFVNPRITLEIIEGLQTYLQRHGFSHINEVIGSLQLSESSTD
ncbi:MAG: dihydroorotate dehydrogenase [Deltaproteobacteria bacterium]|nr:dihydroorotate dehydrogenase [Deltaproteobacteria bacterium]MBW2070182.1 dihydroorotate dehydrogenase [Deltaproteobacteria bacterium]